MCGIFAYINNGFIEKSQLTKLNSAGMKCKERGPDNTTTKQFEKVVNKHKSIHKKLTETYKKNHLPKIITH